MSLLSRILKLTVQKKPCVGVIRTISTSNKKDDTTSVVGPTTIPSEETTVQPKKKKFFYDYGFGGINEKDEKEKMDASFFMYVTLCLVGGVFYFAYRPNIRMQDWALREGYLELRRREQLGLPLIDPNYVDPATINIPSDEELGDIEIII